MAGIIIVVRAELLRVIIVRMLKRGTDDQAIGGVADSSCSNNWSNKSTTSHNGRWLWLLFCLLLLLLVLVVVRLPNGRAWNHRHLVVRSESTSTVTNWMMKNHNNFSSSAFCRRFVIRTPTRQFRFLNSAMGHTNSSTTRRIQTPFPSLSKKKSKEKNEELRLQERDYIGPKILLLLEFFVCVNVMSLSSIQMGSLRFIL